VLRRCTAWLQREMEDDGLLRGGGVLSFALRLTARNLVIANLAGALIQVALNMLGWLPYPLRQSLAVALFITTVVTFLVSMAILLVVGRAIRALAQSRDSFERLSATDPLSELQNRRAFMNSFHAPRPGGLLVLLDIDRFKQVNDSYGHPAGDEVIRGIAATLAEHFAGPGIALARLGGEEFAVLLPQGEAGRLPLLQRVEQARRAVAALRFATVPVSVTISAGVAEAPATGHALEAFAAADRALYAAKRGGRDRVVAAWEQPAADPGRAAA